MSFFITVFLVFSLLIAFFHVINFLYPNCFFAAFLSGTLFLCCCTTSAMDLKEFFLSSGFFYLTHLPHICHSTTSATDLREIFLPSDLFYLKLLLDIWCNGMFHQPAFKGSLEQAVLPWSCRAFQPWFETQTRPISLFESHSVQQNIFLGRFYLCVTALRDTISKSSKFWTYSLISTCIVKCMSYRLGHRSSWWIMVYKCIYLLFINA